MVPLHGTGGPPELQIRNLLNDISRQPLTQIQNNFTELFLWIPSTKIAQMHGYALLNKRAARDPDKKFLLVAIYLNHWSKFKIISQDRSS